MIATSPTPSRRRERRTDPSLQPPAPRSGSVLLNDAPCSSRPVRVLWRCREPRPIGLRDCGWLTTAQHVDGQARSRQPGAHGHRVTESPPWPRLSASRERQSQAARLSRSAPLCHQRACCYERADPPQWQQAAIATSSQPQSPQMTPVRSTNGSTPTSPRQASRSLRPAAGTLVDAPVTPASARRARTEMEGMGPRTQVRPGVRLLRGRVQSLTVPAWLFRR